MTASPVATTASAGSYRPDLFVGKRVLVTGAGGGMGRAATMAFSHCGASLVLSDVDSGALAATLGGCEGSGHRTVVADLGDEVGVRAIYAAADESGPIDSIVACAAVMSTRRALEVTREDWHRVLGVNLLGVFFVLQEAYRRMLPRRSGSVVVVASDAGKRGGGGLVADGIYAASKAAVLSLVKSFARELARSGVRINALTPGPTEGGMLRVSDETRSRIIANLPLGRMGQPEDMAAAMVFLCSPAASFVYGASLNVDGGAMFE